MAGERFQRRNERDLPPLPEFVQGGAPLPQMSLIQQEMGGSSPFSLIGRVMAEENSAPAGKAPSMTDVERIEADAAQLIAAAEKYRQQAGSPLNRALSAVGGVIGAPLNFLGAALGGGDMRQVTAPFRPQQTADAQFNRYKMGIEETLAGIRKTAAQTAASSAAAEGASAKAVRDSLFDGKKFADGVKENLAFAAQNISAETDPNMKDALWNDVLAGYDNDPLASNIIKQYGLRRPWSDNLPRILSQTKDTAARLDPQFNTVTDGGSLVVSDGLTGRVLGGQSQGAPAATGSGGVRVGTVEDGFQYVGGDPGNPSSWRKVN